MTVYEFLHTADKTQIARFLESLLWNCECYGECPLARIANFKKSYYDCEFENILKWLDESMIGGTFNEKNSNIV